MTPQVFGLAYALSFLSALLALNVADRRESKRSRAK